MRGSGIPTGLQTTCPGEYLFLCLMSVPKELREMVWAAKFSDLPDHIIVRPTSSKKNRWEVNRWDVLGLLPALCYVSRQFFDECVPVLIRQRAVCLNNEGLSSFKALLLRVSGQAAFRTVTRLVLLNLRY